MSPIEVEILAIALRDAFEEDGWGDVDPYLFREVVEPVEGSDHSKDVAALRMTLEKVVDALNVSYRGSRWRRRAREAEAEAGLYREALERVRATAQSEHAPADIDDGERLTRIDDIARVALLKGGAS